jgi:transcriptional regulator with XRE-family HTH domain
VSVDASEAELQREIGRRIQAARSRAGLTQAEAAAAAEIDWRRWQRLENGAVNPTVHTLSRVAAALGLTFWELLGAVPPAEPQRQRAKRPR